MATTVTITTSTASTDYTLSTGARGPAGADGASSWGGISGTLSNQTDLQSALNAKAAASHTHVSSEIADATASATANKIALRDSSGRAAFSGINLQFGSLLTSDATEARTWTLPDVSGQIMLGIQNLADLTNTSTARTNLGAVGLTGDETIAGAKTFSGQMELSAQAATNSTSAMTRALGDVRYGEVVTAYKTSDTSRSSTTTYADDPHLSLALTAGTWEIVAIVPWQNADGTGGMKARLNYTGSWTTADSFLSYGYFVSGGSATESTGVAGYFKGSALTNPMNLIGVTLRSGCFRYEGQIKLTTSGTFSIQWAQNASSATASTLPQGTYLTARRVSST